MAQGKCLSSVSHVDLLATPTECAACASLQKKKSRTANPTQLNCSEPLHPSSRFVWFHNFTHVHNYVNGWTQLTEREEGATYGTCSLPFSLDARLYSEWGIFVITIQHVLASRLIHLLQHE